MESLNYLSLNAEETSWTTRKGDQSDKWDRDDTESSWEVEGLTISEKDTYKCIPNYLAAKEGDKVWVIYAVYSTGDSFGRDENGCFEFVNVFANEGDANKAAEALLAYTKYESRSYNYSQDKKKVKPVQHYFLSNGTKIEFGYLPWCGYFERLGYLQVEQMTVGGKKGNRWTL